MEEKKMAKRERTKEYVEWELEWEKKEKKLLLICTAICSGLGLIIGVVAGIQSGEEIATIIGIIIAGIWIGTGIGLVISYFPHIPHMFKQRVQESGGCFGEGCMDNVTDLIKGLLIWLVILSALGPIGFLVRYLMGNHTIKKLEKELSQM